MNAPNLRARNTAQTRLAAQRRNRSINKILRDHGETDHATAGDARPAACAASTSGTASVKIKRPRALLALKAFSRKCQTERRPRRRWKHHRGLSPGGFTREPIAHASQAANSARAWLVRCAVPALQVIRGACPRDWMTPTGC